ncbi:uncharacterized protein HaLaN_08285 [Haematococcus lacustris]|uniref:Uncharacterized protein n=1 Tax=Haematococcus lacustris TaxID=44745 RepID=A0A699YQX6_HAELA|nr:uncharacterized protein HaLaN_08285 [Haematococcus lacustris]
MYAQYIQLQGLYQQLKVQKISDLEGLLEEQEAYVEAMSDAASKLVAHWKEEAERQLALSQAAGAVETLDRLAQLEGATPAAGPAAAEGHTQASQKHVEADSVGDWLPTSAEVQAEAEEPEQPGQALELQAGAGRQAKRRAGPGAEPGVGPGKQLQMRSSKVVVQQQQQNGRGACVTEFTSAAVQGQDPGLTGLGQLGGSKARQQHPGLSQHQVLLQEVIQFEESQKQAFMKQLWQAVGPAR